MEELAKPTNAAQLLLQLHGKDTLSYFSLHEKKQFFFSSTGQSFLAYTRNGKTVLVTGDPIGPEADIPLLLKEFSYFVKGAGLTSCFMAVNKETAQLLQTKGYSQINIGTEAIIQLATFEKRLLKKRVRRAEQYIEKLGITSQVYPGKEIPDYIRTQLDNISQEWLKEKGGKEKRLSMTLGRIPTQIDGDCVIVLAVKGTEVLGYITFVPVYADNSFSLDAMRKRQQTPNGLTEFLLLQSFEYFKARRVKNVSLNFATFRLSKEESTRLKYKMVSTIANSILAKIWKTNNLYTFNEKFLPTWHERYIALEKKRYLPHYLIAIAKAEL